MNNKKFGSRNIIIVALLFVILLTSAVGCSKGKTDLHNNQTPIVQNQQNSATDESKTSVLGDWFIYFDDDYAKISIEKNLITVSGEEDISCNFEKETGYIYADLSSVDLWQDCCIIPIDNETSLICPSAGCFEEPNVYNNFTTSKGVYLRFGIVLLKQQEPEVLNGDYTVKKDNALAGVFGLKNRQYIELANTKYKVYYYPNNSLIAVFSDDFEAYGVYYLESQDGKSILDLKEQVSGEFVGIYECDLFFREYKDGNNAEDIELNDAGISYNTDTCYSLVKWTPQS